MDNYPPNEISLCGKVVGIYESKGKHYIKLRPASGIIDVALNNVKDIYLDDTIIVHCELKIKNIITQREASKQN